MTTRKPYPSDVSDEEWAFAASYLTLMREEAPQRDHSLREVFNALRWLVRTGSPWRYLPNDLPPWYTVYQQTQRWVRAKCFETMVHDLRELLRTAQGRNAQPTAAILDARTVQSTPESGTRAGYDGHKRRKGSKVHMAVDTLGHLLATLITSADEQARDQVAQLKQALQEATGEHVEVAFVDQGYTGDDPAEAARKNGVGTQGIVPRDSRWAMKKPCALCARLSFYLVRLVIWLPSCDFHRTLYVWDEFDIFQYFKDRKPQFEIGRKERSDAKIYVNPLKEAMKYQAILDSGEVKSQAELARKLGASPAKVTQMLNLLKLDEEIREFVLGPCVIG